MSKDKESSPRGNYNESFSSLTINLKVSVKLPNLNIKHFSGNPLELQGLLDSFKAAIHENDNIKPITKFNYLKYFLRGPAAGCISGLNLTTDNCKQA